MPQLKVPLFCTQDNRFDSFTHYRKGQTMATLDQIMNYLADTGTILEKTWKVSSSSSSGTACTDDITLTPGVWLLNILTPNCSASVLYSFSNISGSLSYPYFQMGTGQSCWVPVAITANTNTHVTTASSVSVTYSNTARGKIFAIRIR